MAITKREIRTRPLLTSTYTNASGHTTLIEDETPDVQPIEKENVELANTGR